MAFRAPTRQRPNPRPVPSLWSIALNKAATMAMAGEGSSRREALLAQLSRQPMTEIPAGVTLPVALEQHKEQIMTREGLHGVLSFATGNDLEAAIKTVYVLEKGGAWREWVGPLHLAKHHGWVDALPIQLAADDLQHIGSKATFARRPERVRQYTLFSHRLRKGGEDLSFEEMEEMGTWGYHEGRSDGCYFPYVAKDPPCDDSDNLSGDNGTFATFRGAVLFSIQCGETLRGVERLASDDISKDRQPRRYARAAAILNDRSSTRLTTKWSEEDPETGSPTFGSRITLYGDKAGDEYALYLAIELKEEFPEFVMDDDDDDDDGPAEKAVVELLTTARGSQQEAAVAKARELLGEDDVRLLFGSISYQALVAQRAADNEPLPPLV
ncbi:unnamed protein product [Vitrella brassicaformis CCMP3155]|uniref:Uncharacterized protein n=1 Tax=Vitrella brassicaformis (strain CCMP3155) TaxID=1169540 RepID=A0A0G4F0V5_VITBC|nr:unnamed protein product [Vitrella brassicaformis CCMP3155]|eukprot:CEM05501.1 unnamed protein product [Vitrella brassicaformis CCMP3155]